MATITAPLPVHLGGVTVMLRPAAAIADDVRASIMAAADDVRFGHTVDNMANGASVVYGDPAKLLPHWDALILEVDLPNFAKATELTGSPTEALRRLAAGHHPAGWPVDAAAKSAASSALAALRDRASVLVLVHHFSNHN